MIFRRKPLLLGILIGALASTAFVVVSDHTVSSTPQYHTHTGEFHIHADFVLAVGDERIDLSGEQYMSEGIQVLHPDVHLHDGNQNVIHVHAEGITLATFLDSIGFTLTDECLTLDTGDTFCANETNELALYVNGNRVTDVTTYEMADEDQVLLYYGEQSAETVELFLAEISDEACIYSLTCPERGTPPPESCGLTCEI